MRKDCLRWICLVLCLLLWPSGAAGAAESKVAMGRYVERELTSPGTEYYQYSSAGGMMYAMTSDGGTLFASKDGADWERRETGHDASLWPEGQSVSAFCVGADGTLYLAATEDEDRDGQQVYLERIQGGVASLVPLELPESFYFSSLSVSSSGDLIMNGEMGATEIYQFSADGKLIKKYPVHEAGATAVHGMEMAVYEEALGQMTFMDLQTGEVLRKLPAPEGAKYPMLMGYNAAGSLFMVTEAGIFTVTAGGSLMTQMLDGNLTSLSKPSLMAFDLMLDGDGDPVVRMVDQTTWKGALYGYKFDPSVPTEPTTQISVFSLYDSDALRQAISLMQTQNPEAKVNQVVALPEGTAITRDDAIRTLNTEILAGKGPDVIVLDGLPIKSYIDKGVLLDQSQVLRPMMEAGKLLKNVVGTYESDGKLTAVPTRFLLPTLWGDLGGIESMADLAAWTAANPDKVPTYFIDPASLIDEFYLSCAPAWMGDNGRLDEGKLAEFLQLIQDIRGDWTEAKAAEAIHYDYRAKMEEYYAEYPRARNVEWDPYQKEYDLGNMIDIYGRTAMGIIQYYPYVVRGMEDMSVPNGGMTVLEGGDFIPLPGQSQHVYIPSMVMGINASSPNPELAQKFVLQVLSDEVQSMIIGGCRYGFPVNEAALNAGLALTETPTGGVGGWGNFPELTIVYDDTWPDEAQRKRLRELFDALDTPVTPDYTLHQIVVEQSAPFFDGKMDAQQAAATIAAKANAYLSE